MGAEMFYEITILNKSENATLPLSIFSETVLGKKYLLKLIMFPTHPANDSSKFHQFVSFDVSVMFLWAFEAYSLNFTIAHAQSKIVMLIKIGHDIVLHKKQEYWLNTWNKLRN